MILGAECECYAPLINMVLAAGLSSLLVDGMINYPIYAEKLSWPKDLPLRGVVLASLYRAGLAILATVVLSRYVGVLVTTGDAVVTGISTPTVIKSFLGLIPARNKPENA